MFISIVNTDRNKDDMFNKIQSADFVTILSCTNDVNLTLFSLSDGKISLHNVKKGHGSTQLNAELLLTPMSVHIEWLKRCPKNLISSKLRYSSGQLIAVAR
jgi:hypothetical protein